MSEIVRKRVVDLISEGARIAADLELGGDDDAELDGKLAQFEAWLSECEDKGTACRAVIKSLDSEVARFKEVEKQVAARRKSLEAASDRLRERTLTLLDAMGQRSIKTDDGGNLFVTTRSGLNVEVTNEWELPQECVKTVTMPDKTAIKAYFVANGAVPGATVTETQTRSLVVK